MPVPPQHKSVVSSSGLLNKDFALPPAQTGAEIAILPEKPVVDWATTFKGVLQGLGAKVIEGNDCVTANTQGILWVDHGSKNVHILEKALQVGTSVKWVQLPMSGINAYAPVVKRYPHLIWTSAKGAYAQPVAEHALTLTLALLRHIPLRVRADCWGPMLGYSLFNRRVLIIGAGGISLCLLSLLSPFTPQVTLFRRRATEKLELSELPMTDEARALVDVQGLSKLHENLPRADVVIIAAALTADTHHVIGERELGLMKRTAVLVNIARGEHIDTPALVKALREGQIAGAGLGESG
ncbi:Glyoxylate/hydroxypyruvate reductase (D-isomer-specific 2-hydroxy acid dehydrogenase superfamily) [Ceraceosorus bombacis]|uniref:Glyoxylate/hydroxypyruvate reductase (D-isomer-specific 2-hydroxy acid dehydrogenase superfamily) n=1 Tax=Ceraceosorus bombacis TaxID=401625 RepID=A0A0P1BCX2_9BASI|nr:Glyoxylate/hydroxypyruvate reductase (D-isomer-specific 2-hydroxy acid dehydrogenase superfamily) [Ceraceosorus bombacis]